MLDKIKTLVSEKHMCVLATASADAVPHCSLMAYVANETCTEIYMVTHSDTKKYKNLKQNPLVSLLVDSREIYPPEQAQALTIKGIYQSVDSRQKEELVQTKMLQHHSHLKDFMENPDAVFICVRIDSFLLLNGLTESYFISVSQG